MRGLDRAYVQWAGLVGGPLLAALGYVLLPDTYTDAAGREVAFSQAGRATAALGIWMATWWMTEAIPVYATALLPLAFLPATGAAPMRDAAAPYGHELIFLFMGGFILALAMQRWGLHRRIAFLALRLVGTGPRGLVAGVMGVTALLSMWVSNTATAIMMLPIAQSLIDRLAAQRDGARQGAHGLPEAEGRAFALCLLLGVAYAASIGGVGTLIGTPPNLFLASYARSNLGIEISFVRWMGVGVPVVLILLPITWWLLVRVLHPIRTGAVAGVSLTRADYASLGPILPGEWATFAVFTATASAWILRPFLGIPGLTDSGIAIAAALLLFALPVDLRRREFVMDWDTARGLPWGVLLLFGGGLSLAAAIETNGVGAWIGSQIGVLAAFPPLVLVLGLVALMVFLTELTSNTATTATMVPIVAALAAALELSPLLLTVPVALSASLAFMLPVATPPNAIVFGSGLVPLPEMVRAGLWLNAVSIVVITALTYTVILPVLAP